MSGLIRLALWAVPVATSVAAAAAAAALLPPPTTVLATVGWWAAVLLAAATALVGLDRLARRLLPLATLLRLTLSFPAKAPPRLRVLRSMRSLDELRRRVSQGEGQADTAADLLALVLALDHHDRRTRGHSERVRLYAELVGEELKLSADARDRLRWAALVHDIGKLVVPAAVLNKPGRLDPTEMARVRQHPTEGMRLTAPLGPWLGEWAAAVGQHHERFDGSGYPDALSGQDIGLGGRIVAVADAFETMTASRSYQPAISIPAARAELVRCAGTQFDPRVVRALLNVSVARLRRVAGVAAWLATIPLLAPLQRLRPQHFSGAVGAGVLGVLAVTGAVAPPMPSPGGPPQTQAIAPGEVTSPPAPAAAPSRPPPRPPPAPLSQAPGGADGAGGSPPAAARRPRVDALALPRSASPNPGGKPAPTRTATPKPSPEADDTRAPKATGKVATLGQVASAPLFLHPAGAGDTVAARLLPLLPDLPRRSQPANYDVDRNEDPGLTLGCRHTRLEFVQTDRSCSQAWATGFQRGGLLAGPLVLTFWSALENFATGHPAAVDVHVQDCDRLRANCMELSRASVAEDDWSRGSRGWIRREIILQPAVRVVGADRLLVLTLAVDPARTARNLWLAFGTRDQPSVLAAPVVLPPAPPIQPPAPPIQPPAPPIQPPAPPIQPPAPPIEPPAPPR